MSGEFMRDEMIEARRPPDARRGIWRWFHRSMMVVVGAGLIHGYLIGTETRYCFYEIFYII